MRILHVVTLVDDQSSYGGPLSVALAHCSELQQRGHKPLILGGWRGAGEPPKELEGIPANLFAVHPVAPRLRFSGLFSLRMLLWLHQHARDFDVAHIHLARDLLPLAAAKTLHHRAVPYVVQTHGMIRPDSRISARALDRLVTVPVLHNASTIFSLTPQEDEHIKAVAGRGIQPARLRNGIHVPVIDQAPTNAPSRTVQVLFLARLHPRKRVMSFAHAAEALITEGLNAKFSVVGPDDGDLDQLNKFIADRPGLAGSLTYEGPIPHQHATRRLAGADLYVLPSINEPYPMTILEALAAGVPVVCTESCGLASILRSENAAVISAPNEHSLTEALRSLITDTDYRTDLAVTSRDTALRLFSISAVVAELESIYHLSAVTKFPRSEKVPIA